MNTRKIHEWPTLEGTVAGWTSLVSRHQPDQRPPHENRGSALAAPKKVVIDAACIHSVKLMSFISVQQLRFWVVIRSKKVGVHGFVRGGSLVYLVGRRRENSHSK
jgi:hypothetical protein